MKNNFLKISAIAILLSSVASCSTAGTHDKAPSRIVRSDAEDNLIAASKKVDVTTSEITDSVPSVSDKVSEKIIITKDTIGKAKQEATNIIELPQETSKEIQLQATQLQTTQPQTKLSVVEKIEEVSPKTENFVKVTGVSKNEEVNVSTIPFQAAPAVEKQEIVRKQETVQKQNNVPAVPVEDDIITTSADNAMIGECYGKVRIAGRFKDAEEDVMVQAERVVTNVIPAKYATKEDEIVVKEETFKFIEIPATYKTVTEEVTIEPEKKEAVTIPAQYKTVTEKVMVQPARKVWKKGRGLIEKVGSEGDILCLVEEPAVYKNVQTQVVVAPERSETKTIPAVKRVISKQVIDQPAKVEKIAVPAIKEKVQQRVMVEAEKSVTNTLPAVYQKVKKRIQVSEDRVELLPVICDRNINRDLIIKIQTALVNKGYEIGEIDGFFGKQTSEAVDNFQKSLGLQSGGITYETAKALNIQI